MLQTERAYPTMRIASRSAFAVLPYVNTNYTHHYKTRSFQEGESSEEAHVQ